jgi:hypothetical protein
MATFARIIKNKPKQFAQGRLPMAAELAPRQGSTALGLKRYQRTLN